MEQPLYRTSRPELTDIQQRLLNWFEHESRDLPWRQTRDPYQILVSEIMLQQTQVDRVLPKYVAFLQQFPTLEALAAAPSGDVIRAWSGLGYNRRALNLQRAAQRVLADHQGQFPCTPEALRTLPGIGPYTAGAVACFAFEQDCAFMDTNIRRVIQRVFVGPEQNPAPERVLLELAGAAIPSGDGWRWNQAVMELGALVCTAARPRCQLCPLRSACAAYRTWREADQAVFTAVPVPPIARAVAERPARYELSPRYFRGRIVETLRGQADGAWLSLDGLGASVKPDWTSTDRDWLLALLDGLLRDGLVELDAARAHARLPWTHTA